jgi:hypothetical protein
MRRLSLIAFVFVVILLIKPPRPAYCESLALDTAGLPGETYLKISPTLPNAELDFSDDAKTSCCAHGVALDGRPLPTAPTPAVFSAPADSDPVLVSEFQRANPESSDVTIPGLPVTCNAFETLPAWQPGGPLSPEAQQSLPISAYSHNVSQRPGAVFTTGAGPHKISDFNIEASGGNSRITLDGVQHYSICMARGQNVLTLGNSSDASVMAYAGDDHITLAGNNTNMFTRTGAGQDMIEIFQAQQAPDGNWQANTLYKTAISGGSGIDTLTINETPAGTKWCYVGLYKLYGEFFHVVEFALPPTVTSGPRRQRISIGESIERVRFKGQSYTLVDFLSHCEAISSVALGHVLRPDEFQ